MKKIILNPKYEALRTYIESLPQIMDSDGTYIYGGKRNLIKLFIAPDGTRLNVKRFKKPIFPNNIIYSTGIRKPKGLRAYFYSQKLQDKGFETPESVAYIEFRNSMGIIGYSYYISLQCPYGHMLYEIGNAEEGTYEQLAKEIAGLAAKMHEAKVLHKDFTPGNILWEIINGKYHFSVVDINRMHFGYVSMKAGCLSFARLWGPKRFVSIIVREYARLRGFDADECEVITMKERSAFWKRYMEKKQPAFKLEL